LKEGNDFDEYHDYSYVRKSALIMKLYADDPKIEFEPGYKQIEQILLNCISFIIKSAEGIARVEVELFPFPEYKKLVLKSIRPDEVLVQNFIKRLLKVFEANRIGPLKYGIFRNKKIYFIFIELNFFVEVFGRIQEVFGLVDNQSRTRCNGFSQRRTRA
jgi:hypothetical protein